MKALKPLHRYTLLLFLVVIALMPVHTFVTTWTADLVNANDDALKSVKDVLILTMGLMAAKMAWDRPKIRSQLINSRLTQLIIAYAILHLIVALFTRPPMAALAAGLAFNLRFLVIFLTAQVLLMSGSKTKLRDLVFKIMTIGAAIVASFGFLQVLVLPDDVLSNFGYSEQTVKPYLTIDDNDEFVRINSTLRGPNPLGAYIVITLMLAIGLWHKKPQWRRSLVLLAPLILISLYGSQSRSAVLGVVVALLIYAFMLSLRSTRWRKWFKTAVIIGIVVLPISYFAIRNTEFYQIQILHNDVSDNSVIDSNSERLNSYQQAWEDIKDSPLGEGPGTSGPASRFNDDQSRLSENYYLQIGQEVGLLGAVMFIGIVVLTGRGLFSHTDPIKMALMASLVGLSLINLFLHGWADDTTAIVWWAIAGLYVDNV